MNVLTAVLCILLRRIDRACLRRMLLRRIAKLETLLDRPGLERPAEALPRQLYEARLAPCAANCTCWNSSDERRQNVPGLH